MADDSRASELFKRLTEVFIPYRPPLVTKIDEPGYLHLESAPSAKRPDGFYFGAVKIGKRYVSFHLMPVYVYPELLDDISSELRKRMQGKSCFNFTKPDESLFTELRRLTAAGFARFESDGEIESNR